MTDKTVQENAPAGSVPDEAAENRMMRAILDRLPAMIGYWDRNLRNRFCNRAYHEWFGIDPDEARGKHIREVIGEERYRLNLPYIEKALQGEAQQFERSIPTPDGLRVRHSLAEYIPDIVNGEVRGFFVQVSDVSPLKEAEAALREREQALERLVEERVSALKASEENFRASDQRFRAALANSPTAVFEHDDTLRYTWVYNPKLGYSPEQVIGKRDEDLMDSESARMVTGIKKSVLESGIPARCEISPRLWGGLPETFDLYAEPRRDEQGRIIGLLCTATDITERKRRSELLSEAKAEAERANEAKSRFLAAASHDLRQPLAALRLYADVLDEKLAPAKKPLLANMSNCIDSLGGLLSDLLDLSKLEAGVVTPTIACFPVNDFLSNLNSIYAPKAASARLRLRCVGSGLTARTDQVLLARIVSNYLENALRYCQRGGVVFGCRRHSGKTWIEVWDSGIGIPNDQIPLIFEEFKQLGDDSRSRGSGLGLAIAAKTAALLGLEIRVRSRPGRGSVFAIELPRGEPEAPTAATPALSRSGPLLIALVEDNGLVREALQIALEHAGHQVIAATEGDGLLAALGSRMPDIIISDYRLTGGEKGFDVIARLRAATRLSLPAIIITGDTDPALLATMVEQGVCVLHKPINIENLQARIRELTGNAVSL